MAVQPLDYLKMVKRLVQELGTELPEKVTSVAITPATSYGETTQYINNCVTWINQAWIELQEDQTDWNFMRTQGFFALTAGQAQYDITLQPDLDDYDGLRPFVAIYSPRYIWLADGTTSPMVRTPIHYVPPEHYFGFYNKTVPGNAKPRLYTFTSNGCILLYPPPDSDSLNLDFRYQREVQELVEDTDTPTGLPPKFHMDVVYRAMEYYSGFDETDPQWKRAVARKRKMENKMYIELLPEYSAPGVR